MAKKVKKYMDLDMPKGHNGQSNVTLKEVEQLQRISEATKIAIDILKGHRRRSKKFIKAQEACEWWQDTWFNAHSDYWNANKEELVNLYCDYIDAADGDYGSEYLRN